MAFLGPALPAIVGALATGAANTLFGGKGETNEKGQNVWESVQTPEQQQAYSDILEQMFAGMKGIEQGNMPRAMPIPGQAHMGMNILGGQFLNRNFPPMTPFQGYGNTGNPWNTGQPG